MEKEYNRTLEFESLVKRLGFTKIKPHLYEKQINSLSKMRAEYSDCFRDIIFSYYITIDSNGNEPKIAAIHFKVSLLNLCEFRYSETAGDNYIKRLILDMIQQVHSTILFNE